MSTQSFMLMGEDGNDAVAFDSMLDIEVDDGGKTLTVPIEQGSFASYNKVNESLSIKVTLATGADAATQRVILASLATLKDETTVLSLVTPQNEYQNLTLESYVVTRSNREGSTLLVARLTLIEVRTVTTQTVRIPQSSAKRASDASTVQTGKTQAKDVKDISLLQTVNNMWNGR